MQPRALAACAACAACAAFFVARGEAVAATATYEVSEASEVSFIAQITMGSFVAKSRALAGSLEYDAATGVVHSATIKVKADSFDTGIGLRNQHMCEKYLDVEKYPDIVFDVQDGQVASTVGATSTLAGAFTIKGVRKPAQVEVKVIENTAAKIVVTSQFKLDISDYGFPQPRFMIVKMQPVLDVTLTLTLMLTSTSALVAEPKG